MSTSSTINVSYRLFYFFLSFHSFPLFFPRITHCMRFYCIAQHLRGVYALRCACILLRDNKQTNNDEEKNQQTSHQLKYKYRDWNKNNITITTTAARKRKNRNSRSETHIIIIDLRSNIISNHDWITKFGVQDFLSTIITYTNEFEQMASGWTCNHTRTYMYTHAPQTMSINQLDRHIVWFVFV